MMGPTFAVVDLRSGQRNDVDPILLENDSFPILENAYLFRGRIQRRSCFTPVGSGDGRLKWQIGTTVTTPFTYTLINIPLSVGESQFVVQDNVLGNVTLTDPGGASPVNLLSTDSHYSGTLNRSTGALSIAFTAGSGTGAVIYYPGLPVMGLQTREQADVNNEQLIGFDTRYSYILDVATQDYIAANTYKTTGAIFHWNGTDSDLFWTSNYYGVMWTTNNIPGLNAFTISAGTNATPSVITIGTGHDLSNGDVVEIVNTNGSTTLNGRTFLVQNTNPGAGTFEINNTVLPGGAYNSGYVIVLNRTATSSGTATVTNGDGIKWYDGPGSGTGWVNFTPPLNADTPERLLRGSLMVFPYKNRLVVLNTFESSGTGLALNYGQRARWSQNGTPFYTEDNAATPVEYLLPANQNANFDAWFDLTPGKGGFVDAPTNEVIVSAEFIKDTLIVYFERSTWQLFYTNNETLPFAWQKINTELGGESTFSVVPFDRGVFAVGNYGIVTTDSVNVVRIDQKIPDEVFRINNLNNGTKRVYGVRDYNAQLVYWTYPLTADQDDEAPSYSLTFPNQVLVYNYLDGSWAQFDDSFTCFGYWQRASDLTWAALPRSWESTSFSWNSQVTVARYPNVISGNQCGFTMVYSQLIQNGQNSPSLFISQYTTATITVTCFNHNLLNGQYILITGAVGLSGINNQIFQVSMATVNTFVLKLSTTQTPPTGTYTGGGVITHLPNIEIQTKQFNPYYQSGDSVRLNFIDILADRTDTGQVTIDFFTNSQNSIPLPDYPLTTSPIMLTTPETALAYSNNQDKIWHRVFTNAFGSFFQFVLTLSDVQMRDLSITSSNIKIHALVFYVSPAGRISYDI